MPVVIDRQKDRDDRECPVTIYTYIEHLYSQKEYISIFSRVPKYSGYILISESFINLKQLFTYHDKNGRRKGEQVEEENCVQCRHVAKKRAPNMQCHCGHAS